MLTPKPELRRAELKARARAEFVAMPGLCLTLSQAARLYSAPPDECARAFHELIADGFLWRTRDCFVRADSSRRCA